jgi:hypothetical protein
MMWICRCLGGDFFFSFGSSALLWDGWGWHLKNELRIGKGKERKGKEDTTASGILSGVLSILTHIIIISLSF